MSALTFPCKIFETRNRMDDYRSRDMYCGDMTEAQLKAIHLVDVSIDINPYTMTKVVKPTFSAIYDYRVLESAEKISKQECIRILFNEFRSLSNTFSFYGNYKQLINKLITHMQYNNGAIFRSISLDSALKNSINRDNTSSNTINLIKDTLIDNIDWDKKTYPVNKKDMLTKAILRGRLPKFDKFSDNFNGMGISVHDTWATHITIKSLQISDDTFKAVIHYRVQDHFGLDDTDINNPKFKSLRFFRIWFVLQHYNHFGCKPFITNMEATITLTGGRKIEI
ncbi:DUF3289 family protein [Lelliottia amnigena]|uniref:YPO3983 family protein n=1 Tax=Lelliottia amnigena TaxID=61646 RepID=UPI0020913AAA|nr:YPO3983 family protein [Lelliottia amnigena]USR59939.1 DUF3289 family protein [Lelliottia amnigena]